MSTPAPTEHAIIKTSLGEMTLAFWPDVAPKHVENFKKLAREGFYNGTAFHRILKGFMIQGGCPNTKKGAKGMPGTGDPGYKVKAEFNKKPHVRGVLSAARSSHPDSAGCHGLRPTREGRRRPRAHRQRLRRRQREEHADRPRRSRERDDRASELIAAANQV